MLFLSKSKETEFWLLFYYFQQVKLSLQAQEDAEKARAKKKKKKKPKTAKKEVIKPEISSFLKNQIIKEGENIEMKCRLGMILKEMYAITIFGCKHLLQKYSFKNH